MKNKDNEYNTPREKFVNTLMSYKFETVYYDRYYVFCKRFDTRSNIIVTFVSIVSLIGLLQYSKYSGLIVVIFSLVQIYSCMTSYIPIKKWMDDLWENTPQLKDIVSEMIRDYDNLEGMKDDEIINLLHEYEEKWGNANKKLLNGEVLLPLFWIKWYANRRTAIYLRRRL